MRIKSARKITPEPARCIEVSSRDRLFAVGGETGNAVLTHNSVAQRSIVLGTILRPDSWRFLGVDLKKVELSAYRAYSNVVLGIATTLEDAITVLRFAQSTMMKRYSELEQLGLNNFLDLPNKGQALMVMVDEAGELLGSSGVKALAASTYVPNLNGRANIGELRIGDIVFNSFGQPTFVEDIYEPIQQEQFELRLKGLQSVESGRVAQQVIKTGADHYWVVRCPDSEHEEDHVITTRDLFAELELTAPGKVWRIKRLTDGITSEAQELPLAPALLGAYLAGHPLEATDVELAKALTEAESSPIPSIYLYGSREQRLELLDAIFAEGDSFTTDDLYLVEAIQRQLSSVGEEAVLKQNEATVTVTRKRKVEPWFEVESLTPIEDEKLEEKMICIRVASEDSQFLCTEFFIPTHNTDEGKEQDQLKGEASMIIGSVARLGRAAGVHLVIATQRPDASLIPGETKANLGVRLNCGRTDTNASSMILGNGEGTRVKANPRGRLYLSIYGRGDHGQGFFASPEWIDEYLASKGLNPDGTPLSQKQSRLVKLTDFDSELGEGATLDDKTGVDNSAIIEKIRQQEADGQFDEETDEDWGFGDDEDFVSEEESYAEAPAAGATSQPRDDNWGGLELGKDQTDKNHRHVDDWDAELDDLINLNFADDDEK